MVSRVWAIAASVAADAVRRRVVYVVIFVAFILSVTAPSLPSYGVGVVEAVYREVTLAVTFAAALVVTLALAAPKIPGEVERRTVYNLLAKRVARWEYLVGTWLGVLLTMAWVIAAFAVIAQVVGLLNYGEPMWVLWQGSLGIWLEMGVLAAVALAVSTRFSTVTVILVTLTALFAGHVRGVIVTAVERGAPTLGTAARTLYPSLDTFNVIDPVAHGDGVPPEYVVGMLLVFAGWSGLALLLGALAFRRRDL